MTSNMQCGTLVRLLDTETGMFEQAYWTRDGADVLKQYHYAMKNGIALYINSADKPEREAYIDDISLAFGNNEALSSIEVYATIL